MMGQFLIAYETPIDSMYYEDQPYHIGYRLIGEFIPEPEEPGLEFVNAPYEIRVGNTIQAVVHYFDGTEYIDVTDEVFEYSSGNPEIATITSSGAITGVGVKTVIIAMVHTQKGKPKILKRCTLPLTAKEEVDIIVTEMALIRVTKDGLVLEELGPGFSVEDVVAATEADLIISPNLKRFQIQ
jgi:hypothetical protein